MTKKEKAKDLINKMYQVDDIMGNYPMCFDTAKQCALIAVNEIIKAKKLDLGIMSLDYKYWEKVKLEIEKL
jgi:hypothetical protein